MINQNNKCMIKGVIMKGTKEWNEFVGEEQIYWKNRNKGGSETNETSVTIISPPMMGIIRDILKVATDRYGARFSEYLLVEYGYRKLNKELNDLDLLTKFSIVKDVKRMFQTQYQIPSIDLQFYNSSDKDVSKGKIILHLIVEQLTKIRQFDNDLGFSKVYNTTLACLVYSLGDMLGSFCKDSDFEIYCIDYPKKLKEKIILQNKIEDDWLLDRLESLIEKVNKDIAYSKFTKKEYDYGFDSRIKILIKTLKILEVREKSDRIKELIIEFNNFIKKYPDLKEILQS